MGQYIANLIIVLLIMFMLSIADFSFFGMPWDAEILIQTEKYPNITYNCTEIPTQYIGQTDYPSK